MRGRLGREQVMELFGISKTTEWRWRNELGAPHERRQGRVYYSRTEILDWFDRLPVSSVRVDRPRALSLLDRIRRFLNDRRPDRSSTSTASSGDVT